MGRRETLGFMTVGKVRRFSQKCSVRVAMNPGELWRLGQSTPLGWQQIKASHPHHQSKLVPGQPLCEGMEELGEGRPGRSTVEKAECLARLRRSGGGKKGDFACRT